MQITQELSLTMQLGHLLLSLEGRGQNKWYKKQDELMILDVGFPLRPSPVRASVSQASDRHYHPGWGPVHLDPTQS